MASTTVTVLCPNGRRVNVKATSSTVLLQVLEQACSKQKLDPAFHMLKHHNKVLDLNCSYRYSGLPQNAKLDLEYSDRPRSKESSVLLAVQIEDGSRHQAEFPPVTSLWDVLLKLRLVQDGPRGMEPVVVYMSHQVEGRVGLQGRSLRDLGLSSGRAVVRLLFRPCSIEQAQTEQVRCLEREKEPAETAGEVLTEAPAVVVGTSTLSPTAAVSSDCELPDDDPKPKHLPLLAAEPMEEEDLPYFPAHPVNIFPTDTTASASLSSEQPGPFSIEQPGPFSTEQPAHLFLPEQVIPHILEAMQPFKFPDVPVVASKLVTQPLPARLYDEPCNREQVVYRRDDALPITPTEEVPPSFFDVTAADVHKMHSDLKKQVALADAPLLTSTLRQAKLERQASQYEKSVLRVFLPDGWVLQGCFRPRESLKAVVRFVRENLANPKTKFHLYTAPPKHILKSGKLTLLEAGFVPAAVVYLGLEESVENEELLSQQCLQLAQSALQAYITANRRELTRSLSSDEQSATRPAGLPSQLHSPPHSTEAGHTAARRGGHTHHTGGGGGEGVPKWFKLGKK